MVECAHALGVDVACHVDFDVPRLFLHSDGSPWFIAIPEQFGPLARAWALAHELGHLILHDGPAFHELWRQQEDEADAWAAIALCPIARSKKEVMDVLKHKYQDWKKYPAIENLAWRISYARFQNRKSA